MNAIINSGLATLLPEVATMRREIENYLTRLLVKNDYLPLYSPHIGQLALFETSGHYPYYQDSMYPPLMNYDAVIGGGMPFPEYILKPMNCPFHIEAYSAVPRSYKALPLRFYEFGTVYRHEASGSLNGLLRLRGFTQDDGHIFCTLDQVEQEVRGCIDLVRRVALKFEMQVTTKLSLSDGDGRKWIGEDKVWQYTEKVLKDIVGEECVVELGGAAFYGPKIDFIATDKLGREWQLGTIQLDFNLPDRFKLEYRDANNKLQTPVMIHRALLGSIERFIAILLEQYQGNIPYWLALEQIRIIPVHINNLPYCKRVEAILKSVGVRASVDEEEAPLSAKIKKAKVDKVPIFGVIGAKEEIAQKITINGISRFIDDLSDELEFGTFIR